MRKGKAVTVIGLGLMGSALAHAVANADYDLTVWNRSPEKTKPFINIAQMAGTVRDACAASPVVLVSLTDYGVSDALLHQSEVAEALAGKLLIQLSTGTPAEARRSEEWAKQNKIAYLDGAIMTYPQYIGDEHTLIFFSGAKGVFDENLELLRVLGGDSTYCGEPVGLAAALDLALLDLFFGTAAALLHGAAICASESFPLDEFFRRAPGWLQAVAAVSTTGVGSGSYPRGNSSMLTNTAAIGHIIQASQSAGIDVSFPEALFRWFSRAVNRGFAVEDIPALYEAFRRP